MDLTRFSGTSQIKIFSLVFGTVCVLSVTKFIENENGGSTAANQENQVPSLLSFFSLKVNQSVTGTGPLEDATDIFQNDRAGRSERRDSRIIEHDTENLKKLQYRLPPNLIPFKYQLKLRPILPIPIPSLITNIEAPSAEENDVTAAATSETESDTNSDINSSDENEIQPGSQNEMGSGPDQHQTSARNVRLIDNLTNATIVNTGEDYKFPFQLFTAPGSIRISFTCASPTKKITLHQQNITIHEERVEVHNYDEAQEDDKVDHNIVELDETEKENQKIVIVGFEYDSVQDFMTILLKEDLEAGLRYVVSIEFTTNLLRQDSTGIFSNSYYDIASNTTKFMVGTKFQATFARRAFPCFDEPAMKAVFYISLGRRWEYHTLSNAPLNYTIEDDDHPGWFWDHYEPSLKMSTYLVCFAVSEFTSQEADPALLTNGRAVQVWAPKHFIDKGGGIYAADWTASVVGFLEDYFNMTDALPKVDSIMIPQFTTSAMENWGLITYKEHMLIYVPEENTQYRRSLVSTVVAHELSHHWFGNLVTCRWWSDIWLNEGFATYLSFMVLENLRPELDAQHEFINDVLELSMRSDPKLSTDPVRNTARSQGEIDSAFSRTSYRKGASMVHMMKHFLGEEVLQIGLRKFIKKYAYGSVVQDDLFEELTVAGRQVLPDYLTVKEIMDTWTLKSGYPILRVKALGEDAIKISQETFRLASLDRDMVAGDREGKYWWVPVKIVGSDSTITYPSTWIPKNVSSILYTQNINTKKWILVNPEFAGFYLVLYDSHLTTLIKNQLDLDHTVFSPITRSQILFSYICSSHASYIRKETALDLFTYLGKELDFIVWNTVFPFVGELSRKLLGCAEYHNALISFLVPRLEKVLLSPEIGLHPNLTEIEKEKPTTMFFRTELLSLACQLDSMSCISDPGFYHKLMTTGPDAHVLTTHMEEMMLCAIVRTGGDSAWEFALDKYKTEVQDYAQWWYMKALTCTYSHDLIIRTLDIISNVTLHAFQSNRPGGLHHLATNKYALSLTFNYLMDNFGATAELVTPDVFSSVIITLSNFMYKQEDIIKLKRFIVENRVSLAKELASLSQSLTTMEENMVWMEFHGKAYASWFLQNSNSLL